MSFNPIAPKQVESLLDNTKKCICVIPKAFAQPEQQPGLRLRRAKPFLYNLTQIFPSDFPVPGSWGAKEAALWQDSRLVVPRSCPLRNALWTGKFGNGLVYFMWWKLLFSNAVVWGWSGVHKVLDRQLNPESMTWLNPTTALLSRGVAGMPHLLTAGHILTCNLWLLLVAHVLPGCFSSLSN